MYRIHVRDTTVSQKKGRCVGLVEVEQHQNQIHGGLRAGREPRPFLAWEGLVFDFRESTPVGCEHWQGESSPLQKLLGDRSPDWIAPARTVHLLENGNTLSTERAQ